MINQTTTNEKLCYWCGNTGVTWFDDDWGECESHEYRGDNELSIYAEQQIKFAKIKQ